MTEQATDMTCQQYITYINEGSVTSSKRRENEESKKVTDNPKIHDCYNLKIKERSIEQNPTTNVKTLRDYDSYDQ